MVREEEITRELIIDWGGNIQNDYRFSGHLGSGNKPYHYQLFTGTYVFEDGSNNKTGSSAAWSFNEFTLNYIASQINNGTWVAILGPTLSRGDGLW